MRPRLIRKRGSKRGFSLIELMVVIVLVGIMTAMIIPQMTGTYEDALLRSNSRKLVGVFSLAYSRAVSLNQQHRVRIDTSTGRYVVEKRASQGASGNSFTAAREAAGTQGQIDTRIHIEIRNPTDSVAPDRNEPVSFTSRGEPPTRNNAQFVTFYPDGTAEPCDIILKDRDGFQVSLRIDPVTARVHLGSIARK